MENNSEKRKPKCFVTVYGHGHGTDVEAAIEMGVFALVPRRCNLVAEEKCTAICVSPGGHRVALGSPEGKVRVSGCGSACGCHAHMGCELGEEEERE